MKIQFKKTCWEEVEVPEGQEDFVMNILKTQTACSANQTIANEGWSFEDIGDTDEVLNDYENGGAPTVEVLDDDRNTIWDNGQKEPKEDSWVETADENQVGSDAWMEKGEQKMERERDESR